MKKIKIYLAADGGFGENLTDSKINEISIKVLESLLLLNNRWSFEI
jgi:hypothetical protein